LTKDNQDDKPVPPLILSKTQQQIVPLLAKGLTAEQAAERLGCKRKTISSHLHTAYVRNNVNSNGVLIWRWLNENHAIVPKLDTPLNELPEHKPYLVRVKSGAVLVARKVDVGIWRDDTSAQFMDESEIVSAHAIGRLPRKRVKK
jgi:DNA-binding CsgD family transcriptional regulator